MRCHLNRLDSVCRFSNRIHLKSSQGSSTVFTGEFARKFTAFKSSPESSTAVIADIRVLIASGYTTEVSSVAEEKGKARESEEKV